MIRRALLFALALVTVGWSGASVAQETRGNVFEVDAKIYANGRLVGNPIVRAMAGSEVVVSNNTIDGYGIRLTVDDDHVDPAAGRVNINSRLYMPANGAWVLVSAPGARIKLGATAKVQTSPQYQVEFTARRLDLRASASDLGSLADCPTLKAFADPTPLAGVTVFGTRVMKVSLQENPEEPVPSDPTAGNCCRSGTMTCCGTPGAGTCCRDGMNGNSCCAPS